MIIPIRCMNCGKLLAHNWIKYQKIVREERQKQGLGTEPILMDGTQLPMKTPEAIAMEQLGYTRYCCRKHLLTHRDLIEKI